MRPRRLNTWPYGFPVTLTRCDLEGHAWRHVMTEGPFALEQCTRCGTSRTVRG